MKKISRQPLPILLSLMLCLTSISYAKSGTTAMDFLNIQPGAKAVGMGGAFSAVSDDASAVYWNPAGLARMHNEQLSVMYLNWFEGINYQFLSYARPSQNNGTLAFSVSYLSMGDIPSYDNSGTDLSKSLNASDMALALSYGKDISGINCGVTGKFIQETLAETSASAFALDLGFLYGIKTSAGEKLNIALSAQNLGPGVKYIQKDDPLPANYRIGFSQDFFDKTLALAFDANFPQYEDYYFNAGLQYKLVDWMSLRAGYIFRSNIPQYDIQPGLMGGLGFGNEFISIDYAFVPYGVLGNTHRIGINYRFGKAHTRDLIETKIQEHINTAKKYYNRNDLINSYSEFNNVLLLDPVNSEAKEYLGKIQLKINEVKVQKYLQMTKKYLEQDKLIEAKDLIDKVLLLFPENPEAKDFHARIQVVFQQQKTARIESMFKQGLEFYENTNYADAISLWEKVLVVDPDHLQSKEYISKAKEALAREAEIKKNELEKLNNEKADSIFKEGMKLYKARKWVKAKQTFEEVKDLKPQYPELDKYMAESNKQIAEGYYNDGLKLYKEKSPADAVKSFENALALEPGNNKVNEILLKVSNELKELNKAQAEEYASQGLKEYGLGNLKQAVDLWEKALALDPENVKTKNNLNRAKEELGKKK